MMKVTAANYLNQPIRELEDVMPINIATRTLEAIEQERRMKLEAAAPDLLAACKKALDVLKNMTTAQYTRGGDFKARSALRAAITKATK